MSTLPLISSMSNDLDSWGDITKSMFIDPIEEVKYKQRIEELEQLLEQRNKLETGVNNTKYEQRIKELENQLEHHKDISMQLQSVALESTNLKRKYTRSDVAKNRWKFIKDNMNNVAFAEDLLNGVGLKDIKPRKVPRSLLRAYLAMRYNSSHQSC